MTFKPERTDARLKFAVHTDGKAPLSAIAGPWNPVALWYEIAGEAPDAARLKDALESFPWRGGKVSRAPLGACMLSTPMDGVYLEVIPDDESYLHRFGFSISGTIQEAYFNELGDVAEAKWPGHKELSRRCWGEVLEVRDAALAEAKKRQGIPPLAVPFETVVKNGVTEALQSTTGALSEACTAVPSYIVEGGLDDEVRAERRSTIEAIYFPARDEDAVPSPVLWR
ncbi:hypothetical protein ABIB57_003090 [Devosia sp. UYZn731]|uniref:hypothetical protein n=1 Tax=Devosia sp. UYZn731 TaxID=3156345 RepID=UPI00339211CE